MRNLWKLVVTIVLLGLVAVVPIAAPQPTTAQGDKTCFSETGYCISGAIRDYWETKGGLPVFGYPISTVRMEKLGDWSGPTQWFERDRLEDHGIHGVMAGRLGAYLLQLQDRSWQTFEQVSDAPAGCRYFPETHHSLCEPFLSYWQAHGDVERFGYPITEPVFETVSLQWSGTVQYFERRRMELHSDTPGSPVMLGLLGSEVLDMLENPDSMPTTPTTTTTPTPPPNDPTQCTTAVHSRLADAYDQATFSLGCPTDDANTRARVATQEMEEGIMIWLEHQAANYPPEQPYGDHALFAVIYPGPTFRSYPDTWDADDDPYVPDGSSPSGLYPPRGGFGKVWDEDLDLRHTIGWAVEREEQEHRAIVQPYTGGIIISIANLNTVFVFGDGEDEDEVVVVQQ